MKNQGFTLIELLAVIVILSIIALIAIPMISKIIDKTEDSAVLRSAELYIDGVNQSIMRANLTDKIRPKECIIQEDGNLICDGEYEIKIEATGTKPIAGTLVIEDRTVKSFTGMVLDIYKLEMNEKGKIVVVEKLDQTEIKNKEFISVPNLYNNGLIPVIYKNNNWIVADTTQKWYDYANQEWANAVILKSGVTKNIGDTVNVSSEVQGIFVWIPKYEYKIEGQYGRHLDGTEGTQEQPGEIKVNFISRETTEASSGYRIHPAFIFGTTKLDGIWVGKFETTGTASAPTVLPGTKPLVSQLVSDQFTTSQIFKTYIADLNVDTHIARNSEWGAVAYLSQSKYGKYGNTSYSSSEKKIMLNNCSSLVTGVAANSYTEVNNTSTCTSNIYTTIKGQTASTTGNITGIYDMSGGAHESVMGILEDSNGNPYSGFDSNSNSGYIGKLYDGTTRTTGKNFPDKKYYELYTRQDIDNITCDGGICYGQALSETKEWYGGSYMNVVGYPWIMRGGNYGVGGSSGNIIYGGIFQASNYTGKDTIELTFRVVITES